MNFDFLKDNQDFKELYYFCSNAERIVISQPNVSTIYSKNALESIVKSFYKIKYESYPQYSNLFSLLDDTCFSNYLDDSSISAAHLVRQIGNNAAHGEKISKNQAIKTLEALYYSVCEILKLIGVISFYEPFNAKICESNKEICTNLSYEINKEIKGENNFLNLSKYEENINKSTKIHAPIDFTEEETRKIYIDSALKEAGWEICTKKMF